MMRSTPGCRLNRWATSRVLYPSTFPLASFFFHYPFRQHQATPPPLPRLNTRTYSSSTASTTHSALLPPPSPLGAFAAPRVSPASIGMGQRSVSNASSASDFGLTDEIDRLGYLYPLRTAVLHHHLLSPNPAAPKPSSIRSNSSSRDPPLPSPPLTRTSPYGSRFSPSTPRPFTTLPPSSRIHPKLPPLRPRTSLPKEFLREFWGILGGEEGDQGWKTTVKAFLGMIKKGTKSSKFHLLQLLYNTLPRSSHFSPMSRAQTDKVKEFLSRLRSEVQSYMLASSPNPAEDGAWSNLMAPVATTPKKSPSVDAFRRKPSPIWDGDLNEMINTVGQIWGVRRDVMDRDVLEIRSHEKFVERLYINDLDAPSPPLLPAPSSHLLPKEPTSLSLPSIHKHLQRLSLAQRPLRPQRIRFPSPGRRRRLLLLHPQPYRLSLRSPRFSECRSGPQCAYASFARTLSRSVGHNLPPTERERSRRARQAMGRQYRDLGRKSSRENHRLRPQTHLFCPQSRRPFTFSHDPIPPIPPYPPLPHNLQPPHHIPFLPSSRPPPPPPPSLLILFNAAPRLFAAQEDSKRTLSDAQDELVGAAIGVYSGVAKSTWAASAAGRIRDWWRGRRRWRSGWRRKSGGSRRLGDEDSRRRSTQHHPLPPTPFFLAELQALSLPSPSGQASDIFPLYETTGKLLELWEDLVEDRKHDFELDAFFEPFVRGWLKETEGSEVEGWVAWSWVPEGENKHSQSVIDLFGFIRGSASTILHDLPLSVYKRAKWPS
ncbi:hypothetical protein L202_05858 [Cryptococcus amylolentus CBS 6039]|uniref:MHD1 domain-containing protein n=1 Tax=Cryptococcus amylolentus CBS 6039 TaxID=1295533 RepID=A0A1E3HHP0_9TREE|nr:hypothetical protein L202_05858 [Cryptococcus amylolentus CBS 6039]ODN75870.1 hypothetical protein L202_05858 [Cryptococcus amylolentus CBS 6039]